MLYTVTKLTPFENIKLQKTKELNKAIKIAFEKQDNRNINIILATEKGNTELIMSIFNKNVDIHKNNFVSELRLKELCFKILTKENK